jgi:uncharacterized damage-inducible protein DinB
MLEAIILHYDYNTWANDLLLKTMEQLTDAQYNAPNCSGNGSTRDTLAHLLSTQVAWFSWLDGSLPLQQALAPHLKGEDIRTVEDAQQKWVTVDEQTKRYLAQLTEEQVMEEQPFTLPNGTSSSMPLWQFQTHVANHATHTRGQIIAAIRREGISPGSYDMVRYLMSRPS